MSSPPIHRSAVNGMRSSVGSGVRITPTSPKLLPAERLPVAGSDGRRDQWALAAQVGARRAMVRGPIPLMVTPNHIVGLADPASVAAATKFLGGPTMVRYGTTAMLPFGSDRNGNLDTWHRLSSSSVCHILGWRDLASLLCSVVKSEMP
jgi:hypothetical protein